MVNEGRHEICFTVHQDLKVTKVKHTYSKMLSIQTPNIRERPLQSGRLQIIFKIPMILLASNQLTVIDNKTNE